MAECKEYTHLISAALDGELTPQEQAELDAHLARCPQCRELMEQLSGLRQTLAQLPLVQPPPQLKDDIMAAVAQNAAPRRGSRWPKGLACAAVAALVLTAAWRLGIPTPGVNDASFRDETAAITAETAEDDAAFDRGGGSLETGAARDSVAVAGGATRAMPAGGDATAAQNDAAAQDAAAPEAVFEQAVPKPAQKASIIAEGFDSDAEIPYAVQSTSDGDVPLPIATLFQELEPAVYSVAPDAEAVAPTPSALPTP